MPHPSPPDDVSEKAQTGPKFDRVMRSLASFAPAVLCAAFTDRHEPVEAVSESFPAATRTPDQLFKVPPDQLIHVEFETHPGRSLVPRMLVYRGLIMQRHPDLRLEQHVVVLDDRRVTGHDDLTEHGFLLDLKVTYLREQDPARFLGEPVLAPMAVLARGNRTQRAEALRRALDLIRRRGGHHTADLLEAAIVMATIHLDGPTIDAAMREIGMSIESIATFYESTELGQELVQRGRQEGRQEGISSARAAMLSALLVQRFGAQPEVELLARRLAARPEADSIRAVATAGSLQELLASEPA